MPSNKTGRPYTQGITEALLQAAERVMVDHGYSALTIDALATEVGTTRPTFYRRFPSVAHLALEVIRNRFGTGSDVDTGSLYKDLLAVQRAEVAMFSSPLLRRNLPGLLAAVGESAELSELYERSFIGPRRENVARIVNAAGGRGEIDPSLVDIEYICDQLVGPILSRALLPVSAPLDDRLARQTADAALIVMGARSFEPETS